MRQGQAGPLRDGQFRWAGLDRWRHSRSLMIILFVRASLCFDRDRGARSVFREERTCWICWRGEEQPCACSSSRVPAAVGPLHKPCGGYTESARFFEYCRIHTQNVHTLLQITITRVVSSVYAPVFCHSRKIMPRSDRCLLDLQSWPRNVRTCPSFRGESIRICLASLSADARSAARLRYV